MRLRPPTILGPATLVSISRAVRLNATEPKTAVFVSSLLRARELKMAAALRGIGWKVILLYKQMTPFSPEKHFDIAIRLPSDGYLHRVAKMLQPRVCHVFSGAVDDAVLRICRDKPGPVVVDLNDIFCPSQFSYHQERFAPTREVLQLADGLCARDLQAKNAERLDGFTIPAEVVLFPEYCRNEHRESEAPIHPENEVHVVSVGMFTLEKDAHDSAYLELARQLAAQQIHFHIYPHWFYQKSRRSIFRFDQRKGFADFYALAEKTEFLHIHQSLPLDALARELPRYDFGIVAAGSARLNQKLGLLKPAYLKACYSGRISDYLDAGLPVIVNPELGFDHHLLSRLKVLVDLDGLYRPGFKDRLLAFKHDATMRSSVRSAAQSFSLTKHAPRLAAFYEKVAARQSAVVRLPLWFRAATRLPGIGPGIRRISDLAASSAPLTQEVERLRVSQTSSAQQLAELRGALRLRSASSGSEAGTLAHAHSEKQLSDPEAHELIGLLDWQEMNDPVERTQGYGELMRIMQIFVDQELAARGNARGDLSALWQTLNRRNLDQLLADGYRRFKRTVALNYFTFAVKAGDPQIARLEALVDEETRTSLRTLADTLPDDRDFAHSDQAAFRYHLLLLHAYARQRDRTRLLGGLEEPAAGSPVAITVEGRRISQDLANSVIEYDAIREGLGDESPRRILEVGGGYGRDAFVFLSAYPSIQYVMVDVPPALYIAQRYLSSLFRDRPVFRVDGFTDFRDVRARFEGAAIAFLLPHQLRLIPPGYFDLALNISSLHEMRRDQVSDYFDAIDRVTDGYFYTKQWQEYRNPFDQLVMRRDDYPVKPHWRQIFSREAAAQGEFFEAMYRVGKPR